MSKDRPINNIRVLEGERPFKFYNPDSPGSSLLFPDIRAEQTLNSDVMHPRHQNHRLPAEAQAHQNIFNDYRHQGHLVPDQPSFSYDDLDIGSPLPVDSLPREAELTISSGSSNMAAVSNFMVPNFNFLRPAPGTDGSGNDPFSMFFEASFPSFPSALQQHTSTSTGTSNSLGPGFYSTPSFTTNSAASYFLRPSSSLGLMSMASSTATPAHTNMLAQRSLTPRQNASSSTTAHNSNIPDVPAKSPNVFSQGLMNSICTELRHSTKAGHGNIGTRTHPLPTPLQAMPLPRQEMPASRHEMPTSRHEIPASRHEMPASRHEMPASRHEMPASRHEMPTSRHEIPASRHEMPASRHEMPASRHEMPASRHETPTPHVHPVKTELSDSTEDVSSQSPISSPMPDFLADFPALNAHLQQPRHPSLKRTHSETSTSSGPVDRPSGSSGSEMSGKDPAYLEKRRKNNESAKRSREARRNKEEMVAKRVIMLEEENMRLKAEVALVAKEMQELRHRIYNC